MIKDILNIKLLNIQESETKPAFDPPSLPTSWLSKAIAANVSEHTYLVMKMYCLSSLSDHPFLSVFSSKNLDRDDKGTDSGQKTDSWASAVCGTLELGGSVGS
jgi:hypothetical protein